jgi:hypothetical protein
MHVAQFDFGVPPDSSFFFSHCMGHSCEKLNASFRKFYIVTSMCTLQVSRVAPSSSGPGPKAPGPSLTSKEEEFVKKWFSDFVKEEDFEKEYEHYMGAPAAADDPPPGSHRRIIASFLHADDDSNRLKKLYLLELYHHQASGDRAVSENWFSRLAILLALLGVWMILLIELLKEVQAGLYSWLLIVLAVLVMVFTVIGIIAYSRGNRLYGWLKRLGHGGVVP